LVCGVRAAAVRIPEAAEYRLVDFATDFDPAIWTPRLQGVDVVINAVGILRQRGTQTFDALHWRAPRALFSAASEAGLRCVQISALGADADARSAYHLSKKRADDFLATLPVDWVIVQPGLVYGAGGASARLFTAMASLPLVPVPGRGDQLVQPIHIDDFVSAVVALVESKTPIARRIPLVGPRHLPFRDMLRELRHALGLPPARLLPIPATLMRAAARVGGWLQGGMLDTETLEMLLRGNAADPGETRRLLGREPRPLSEFVRRDERDAARAYGQLQWLLPLLRFSVALVWIVTGIVSLGVFPVQESHLLLARAGVPVALAPLALYASALLDLALGLASLLLRRRQILWLVQIMVIVGYSVIITWKLPEFWSHPYGPLLKNIPLLVAIGLLYSLERR
jgi:uncharacterized protein YbjT (DUF2867 family)